MNTKLPRLIRIKGGNEDEAPSCLANLARAIAGCELSPSGEICYFSEKKAVWLVLVVKVADLKRRYPEIFRKFHEKIRIHCGDSLAFGGSTCKIIR